MRIARALALGGIDSRRKCEIHVKNGAVVVNGKVVREVSLEVDPDHDVILFRGRLVEPQRYVYYILNKPEGYTTTASDPHAKKTVYELLPRNLIRGSRQPSSNRTRVFPVGRLDRDSSGLLFFTNDGELANRLAHPKFQVKKWYEVRLNRPLEPADKSKLLAGMMLSEGVAKVEKLENLTRRIVRLLIREGKKREIRRMFEKVGYNVLHLVRISFGPIALGKLGPGHGRFLSKSEVADIKRLTKLPR
ncbi:MAG: rRNA pseudouridine synthase [Candidatus Omnitrophica bacterium]|nr:rRNA pseudouridine synthase [Candidatus Omnitrophota bacterium]